MNIKLRKLLLPFCHKICSHFCPICTQLELYRYSCFDTIEALESVYDLLIEYEKENGSNTHIERTMRIVEEALGEEVINCLKKNTKRNMLN